MDDPKQLRLEDGEMMKRNNQQITFEQLMPGDRGGILEMSRLATDILHEHYDPILGKAQNGYMLENHEAV